jgi:hypothetical protein
VCFLLFDKGVKNMISKNNWLADSMMNLLVDYYTEVQFRPYGAGATRENILPVLHDLDLGYICIYAKGHSGYTSWHSSLKTAHNMLSQDMPKIFREVTTESDTKLVLYYSGLLDGIAGLRHPEWRMIHSDGSEQRYFDDFKNFTSYANCPHSDYFDEWVAVHLRELIEGYNPDGIWVDGDWPSPCYCSRCKDIFRQEIGWTENWSDIQQRIEFNSEYTKFWNRVTARWRERFNNFVKSLKPDCVYSAGNVSPRREFIGPFDWRSGDFFSPGFFYLNDIARMMRWYDTLGVPYDAYICDTSFTHARKHVRSRTKTLDRMLQEAATVASNGGAVGYWTYPTGDGALVPSRMKKAKLVRQFLKERENIFLHTQSAGWTAIVITDPATPTFGGSNVEGAHKAMAALHRSPELMDETGVSADMPHRLVVVPEQVVITDETAKKLVEYTERGGLLLSSGQSINSSILQSSLGITKIQHGAVQDGHVLLKSCDEPTGIDSGWDKIIGSDEMYPLYLSWDQLNPEVRNLPNNWPMHGQLDELNPEPAGFPAAIFRKVGKGQIVHICTDIFSQYKSLGDPQILRWLDEIIDTIDQNPFIKTDVPSWIDISLRKKDNKFLIHFVNQNPGRDVAKLGTDDTWVDEIPEVGPYTIDIQLPQPNKICWQPDNVELIMKCNDDIISIEVPRFKIHGCIVIE